MQNGYGGIHTLTVFPVLYRSFSHFSEETPVLLDAELGFVDSLKRLLTKPLRGRGRRTPSEKLIRPHPHGLNICLKTGNVKLWIEKIAFYSAMVCQSGHLEKI